MTLARAVSDEVLRYLYFASLRPLATLAVLVALVVLVVVLAVIAWQGHRSHEPAHRRVQAGPGSVRAVTLLAGTVAILAPLLLP